uniref:Uncharacterized protein n=1 Tax=Populus alba TaxID=43335 RepID=A0A4U5QV76_POPAL|nr:hypothetical protein D5086_0000036270 [Populus alba]
MNPKKSFDGAFRSTTQYVSPKINKESYDLSPVSEISDAYHCCQTAIISILALKPVVSAPTETSSVSDNTPASKISTITDESASVSTDCCGLNKASIKIGQGERLEANIMVILLKEDRIVALKADVQSKKLMGALIKFSPAVYGKLRRVTAQNLTPLSL